jgi:Helix-hairpin-helix motif
MPEGSHPQQLARYRSQVLAYVNAASVHQLQKLATVGTKAAQSIVKFRNVSGRYGDLDALQNVPGLRNNFYSNFLKVSIFFKREIRDFLYKFSFACTAGQSSGLLISHRLGRKCEPRNFYLSNPAPFICSTVPRLVRAKRRHLHSTKKDNQNS